MLQALHKACAGIRAENAMLAAKLDAANRLAEAMADILQYEEDCLTSCKDPKCDCAFCLGRVAVRAYREERPPLWPNTAGVNP